MRGRGGPAARDVLVAALFCVVALGWAMVPAVVRHQAGVEPLLHETVPIAGAEPAGGAAWRAVLPDGVEARSWAPGFFEVLEGGRSLARARPGVVRREGGGRYSVASDGGILFAPHSSGSTEERPARIDPGAYAIRRPFAVPEPLLRWSIAAFFLVSLAAALLVFRGLHRSRLLGGLARWIPLTLAGWIAASLALDATVPWTGSELVGQKMALLHRDIDDYDAVFIGSSRVYRQLEPATFDAVFAEAGLPMRSFNLGAPDMRMLEVIFLARWLLETRPERLGLLVIDAESDPLLIREENLWSERIVRWHDLRNYAAILGELWRSSPSRAVALYRSGRHAGPFARHATQLGRGRDRIGELVEPRPPEAPPEQRGFFAGDEEMAITPSAAQRRDLEYFNRRLHDDLDRYRRDIERLARSPREGALTDRFEIELYAELERVAARAGVETVFLIDPEPLEKPNLVWAADNGVVGTLLRFDDPLRYPELYDPALRFDRHHVNKVGARLYTAEVARRIVESMLP